MLKNKIIDILLVSFFSFFVVEVTAQNLKYEILIKNNKIGKIESSIYKLENNSLKIKIVADVKFDFILTEDVKFIMETLYKNGKLKESYDILYLNGNPHFSSSIKEEKPGVYLITRKGQKKTYEGEIKYSGSLLAFFEPKNIKSLFSEVDDIEKNITKVGESEYKITNPKTEYESFFTYQNGTLKKAVIHHKFFDVSLIRID